MPLIEFPVKSRFSGEVQFTAEIEAKDDAPCSLKLGLAVKWGLANGANLSGANLDGANLYRANLYRANLSGANLNGASLYRANLNGADLYGADLDVKEPPVNSHQFISEILFRAATNFKERSWAGVVRVSVDWCWEKFLEECPKTMTNWAKEILCEKWPVFEEKFKGR
jgi:hypothetical protein